MNKKPATQLFGFVCTSKSTSREFERKRTRPHSQTWRKKIAQRERRSRVGVHGCAYCGRRFWPKAPAVQQQLPSRAHYICSLRAGLAGSFPPWSSLIWPGISHSLLGAISQPAVRERPKSCKSGRSYMQSGVATRLNWIKLARNFFRLVKQLFVIDLVSVLKGEKLLSEFPELNGTDNWRVCMEAGWFLDPWYCSANKYEPFALKEIHILTWTYILGFLFV